MDKYKIKSIVISEGDDKLVKKYDYLAFKKMGFLESLDLEEAYLRLLSSCGRGYIKECRRVYRASASRIRRLKERIKSYLVRGACIFATFTFTDEVLAKTSIETRRKYVSRFCKSVSDYYVANIDYGVDDKFTHREHYHALLLTDFVSLKWDYGWSLYERVHKRDSYIILSKYICKLTNHAIKDSTKRNYMIYSRNLLRD